MTDLLAAPPTLPSLSPLGLNRARARRTASRHSRLVKVLRGAMIGGVATLVLGIVLVVVHPFRTVAGLSIAGTAVDGTRVTMDKPRLSGFQKDGRPYVIEASRAVQDLKAPSIFELHDLTAHLTMVDKRVTRMTAEAGTYNSTAETMNLTHGAHVVSDGGLDAVTASAMVTFKDNSLVTDQPVTVAMPGRTIAADGMRIVDGGRQITFDGHVRSRFEAGSDTPAGSAPPAAPVSPQPAAPAKPVAAP